MGLIVSVGEDARDSSQRENTGLTTSRDDLDRRERWMGLTLVQEYFGGAGVSGGGRNAAGE